MNSRYDILVSDLCYEINQLQMRLEDAETRAKYWAEKHAEVCNESIAHSQKMMGNVLVALLNKEAA